MSSVLPPSLTHKERYELARENVCREDDLVNSRTTWFLAFQALLFAAFFQVVALGDPEKLKAFGNPRAVIIVLSSIIAVVGVLASFAWAKAVALALEQIAQVEAWFAEQGIPTSLFPPLRQRNESIVTATGAAAVVALAWLSLATGALLNLKAATS